MLRKPLNTKFISHTQKVEFAIVLDNSTLQRSHLEYISDSLKLIKLILFHFRQDYGILKEFSPSY